MPNQNRLAELSPEHLSSVVVFSKWVRDNIKIYNPNDTVPIEHIKLYVEYIENAIRKTPDIDSRLWLQLITTLQNHIKVTNNDS